MRNLHELNRFRRTDKAVYRQFGGIGDDGCGVFQISSCIDKAPLVCIASSGLGWDHVSVSRRNRTPNWPEMDQIYKLFFLPTEAVMQLHVPAGDHINDMPNCLHLWRPRDEGIPRPPFGWSAEQTTPPEQNLPQNTQNNEEVGSDDANGR